MTEPRYPQVLAKQVSATSACLSLHIPAQLLFFKGHFEGTPILPGVVQMDWAIHYAKQLMVPDFRFAGADVIKYQQPIKPDMQLQLQLDWDEARQKLTFSYHSDLGNHATGKLKSQR
ncbi:3-hydroxyacyl-ACP dehydratase [Paraferrimonas haliotis]|uniref:3-hydroxyacyl-ACP dehydratase n=1 Tax=Paraferrimonas haliotis TaxID=2013866 RepID=A0AA37TV45_9GAMM|nr:3-hydroxyacyl-ACP dehydratase [Paraferrimonas haliotis]GLS83170.1 3-hydroxyacyl-ACP dehydratase [Paraferrimonas haliotis]